MSWIRSPLIGGSPVVLPPLFCGLPGFGPSKSGSVVVRVRGPAEALERVVVVRCRGGDPVPSRQGLLRRADAVADGAGRVDDPDAGEVARGEVGDADAVGLVGSTVPE